LVTGLNVFFRFGLFFLWCAVYCLVFIANVDLKDSSATFFPLLFKMVKLRSAREDGLFLFFARCDCFKSAMQNKKGLI
jgi:hypothetical protein